MLHTTTAELLPTQSVMHCADACHVSNSAYSSTPDDMPTSSNIDQIRGVRNLRAEERLMLEYDIRWHAMACFHSRLS
jgi:hypothetical protein